MVVLGLTAQNHHLIFRVGLVDYCDFDFWHEPNAAAFR